MFKKITTLLVLISSLAFGGNYPVNSIEYSISLKTDKFQNGFEDVKKYQASLFDKVAISRIDDDEVKLDDIEKVSYWDTDSRLFRNQKIIIRHRGNDGKYEITVKYRGTDKKAAENWNLTTSVKSKSKTEIDRYINKDSFSRSITVKTKADKINSSLLLKYFPDLYKYGLNNDTKIKQVHDFTITSKSYEIGSYMFGKKKAKKKTTTSDFDLALWTCNNGNIIAAEVSWKIRNTGIKTNSALDRASKVLNAIHSDTTWVAEKSRTKTSIAYEGQNICK